METLTKILSSKVRAEIFRILFDGRLPEFHVRAIERESSMSYRSVQQELRNLLALDLLVKRRDGNRLYFKANDDHPLYTVVCELISKTVGYATILKKALKDSRVRVVFIFGSFARGEEHAMSDLDLAVIGDIGMFDVTSLLEGCEERIGREINPHVFKASAFAARLKKKDHFVSQLMQAEKQFIIGANPELKQICQTE